MSHCTEISFPCAAEIKPTAHARRIHFRRMRLTARLKWVALWKTTTMAYRVPCFWLFVMVCSAVDFQREAFYLSGGSAHHQIHRGEQSEHGGVKPVRFPRVGKSGTLGQMIFRSRKDSGITTVIRNEQQCWLSWPQCLFYSAAARCSGCSVRRLGDQNISVIALNQNNRLKTRGCW